MKYWKTLQCEVIDKRDVSLLLSEKVNHGRFAWIAANLKTRHPYEIHSVDDKFAISQLPKEIMQKMNLQQCHLSLGA